MNHLRLQTEQVRGHRRFDRTAPVSDGPVLAPGLICYRFVSGYDDHVVAHLWDGTAEDTEDVLIALDPQLRKSLVGTGYTYAGFQNRTRDSDGAQEQMFPAFEVGGLLFAMTAPCTGVQVSGVELAWQMMVPSVHWMRMCS